MASNYGTPFTRVQVFGSLYTAEAFSFTLSFAGGGAVARPSQAQADAVGAAVTAFWRQSVDHIVASPARLQGLKVARIGADGKYIDNDATQWAAPDVNGIPGSGSNTPAPQLALAVSLRGANPRGAAGRGRFYLPAPHAAIQNDGRISEDAATDAAVAASIMVQAMGTALGLSAYVVGKATPKGRGPARQEVQGVAVGRVLDTIRSRRTSLPEEHEYSGWGGGGGAF